MLRLSVIPAPKRTALLILDGDTYPLREHLRGGGWRFARIIPPATLLALARGGRGGRYREVPLWYRYVHHEDVLGVVSGLGHVDEIRILSGPRGELERIGLLASEGGRRQDVETLEGEPDPLPFRVVLTDHYPLGRPRLVWADTPVRTCTHCHLPLLQDSRPRHPTMGEIEAMQGDR